VAPEFAWLKIFTFLGLQFGLGGVVVITAWSLISPPRRTARGRRDSR